MKKFNVSQPWYHGTPLHLSELRQGSTITQYKYLARIFSHKPSFVAKDDDGRVKHNGKKEGILYIIDEHVQPGDVIPHPTTAMDIGEEWITTRPLRLKQIAKTEVDANELLSEEDIAFLFEKHGRV